MNANRQSSLHLIPRQEQYPIDAEEKDAQNLERCRQFMPQFKRHPSGMEVTVLCKLVQMQQVTVPRHPCLKLLAPR
eukprot:1173174-Amphidinium_carterae.1